MAAFYRFYKVKFEHGVIVRNLPNKELYGNGRVLPRHATFACVSFWDDRHGTTYGELIEDGWVVIRSNQIVACEETDENVPIISFGEWSYEVVHPVGARFAKYPDISRTGERLISLYPKGTVLTATCKITSFEDQIPVTRVKLANRKGWIFEHLYTHEVFDRLDNELIVIPIDEFYSNRR